MKRIILFFLIFLISSNGYANVDELPLKFVVESDKKIYMAGDDIKLMAKVINISDQDVTFYKDGNQKELFFNVLSSYEKHARPVSYSRGFQEMIGSNLEPIVLRPNELFEFTEILGLTKEKRRFNFSCTEWKINDLNIPKTLAKECVKQDFDEEERYVIRNKRENYVYALSEFILTPNSDKVQLQAMYYIKNICNNLMLDECSWTSESTDGELLTSKIVEFNILKNETE